MGAMAAPSSQDGPTARPYSQHLRDREHAVAHAGLIHGAVAGRFAVGESTVRSWLRRERVSGSTTVRPNQGGGPKLDTTGAAALRARIAERDDRTLAELTRGLREHVGSG